MNRTTLLQDRRMEKFEELLKRGTTGSCRVSRPGSFWAVRHGSSAATDGATRRTVWTAWSTSGWARHRRDYAGWNVKYFHEHLQLSRGRPWSYSWVKTKLQAADLVPRMRRRSARPAGSCT